MHPSDHSKQHLIFIEPKALMEMLDTTDAVWLKESRSGSGELGLSMMKTGDSQPPDTTEIQQDGITIYIDNSIETGDDQQINISLKPGWIRNKIQAVLTKKQKVPGFMGIRKCR